MKKSKLLLLFNALPTAEVRGLTAFARSPAVNVRDDVARLVEHLLRQRVSRTPEYGRDTAWATIFPEKNFNDAEMRLLMSRTNKLLEQYLAWREFLKDEVRQGIYLARAFRNLGMEEGFRGSIEAVRAQTEAAPLRNTAYLRDRFFLEFERLDYLGGQKRAADVRLQDATDALDAWYFAEKLRWICGQLTLQTVARTSASGDETGWLEDYLNGHPALLEHLAVAVWFTCFKALTSTDAEPWYQKLRALLAENSRAFTDTELRDLYMLCLNYYIRRWNRDGERRFAEEGFQLYREGFEAGWLLVDGVLSHFTYINAVALALRVGAFEWAQDFIEQFKRRIADPKIRENSYVFCLARLHYEKGEHTASMRLLAGYAPDDPYHFLIAKILLMKMYFEQGEHDALDSLLETMRQYLKRNEAGLGYQRDYFENIIQIARALLNLRPGDEKELEKIREKIGSISVSSDREWFLGQLRGRK